MAYGHGLLGRERILVLNKKELLNKDQQNKLIKQIECEIGKKVFSISAAMNDGLDLLLSRVWEALEIK